MNTNYETYELPGVTVDLVIFTVSEGLLKALLVKRAEEPFAGCWSIPGGFLKAGESLDDAAVRVMHDKTGVKEVYLEQLYTFGDPDRDPRARVITVTYFALIPWKNSESANLGQSRGCSLVPCGRSPLASVRPQENHELRHHPPARQGQLQQHRLWTHA